jgi:two-component system cell cycle response regulator CpdR
MATWKCSPFIFEAALGSPEPERVSRPRQKRVLVAEDDDEFRELMVSALRADGYEVDEAMSGFELSALLVRPGNGYDLVVSDIRMPGQSGLEAIDASRINPAGANLDVPVILVTAFGDRHTCLEAGRREAILLDKPLDMNELRTWAASLLSTSRLFSC